MKKKRKKKNESFVVITNDCQWRTSMVNVLVEELYSNADELATWPRVANVLQRHVLLATRQIPCNRDNNNKLLV